MERDINNSLGRTETVKIPVDAYGYPDPQGRDVPHLISRITIEPTDDHGMLKIQFKIPAIGEDKYLETRAMLGGNLIGAKRSISEAIRDAALEQLPRHPAERRVAAE